MKKQVANRIGVAVMVVGEISHRLAHHVLMRKESKFVRCCQINMVFVARKIAAPAQSQREICYRTQDACHWHMATDRSSPRNGLIERLLVFELSIPFVEQSHPRICFNTQSM